MIDVKSKNQLMYMRRCQRGLRIKDISDATGICMSSLSALENKKLASRADTLYAASVMLDVSIEDLIPDCIKEEIDEKIYAWKLENGLIE